MGKACVQRQRPRATKTINKQKNQGGRWPGPERHLLVQRCQVDCTVLGRGAGHGGSRAGCQHAHDPPLPMLSTASVLGVPAPVRRPLSTDFTLEMHPSPASTNLPGKSKLTFPGVRWTPDGSHPSNREGEVRNDVMTKSGDQLRARGSLHVSFVTPTAHLPMEPEQCR